ncbi:MAG: hypothetical protein F4Y02_06055 [Chloroflexi bacterium]|nr:hypothetical protein [Chloroflexota bacterium]
MTTEPTNANPMRAESEGATPGSAADRLVERFRRQATMTAKAAGTGRVPAAERVIQRIRNGINAVVPGAGDACAQEMRYAVLALRDTLSGRTMSRQWADLQPVVGREQPGWLLAPGHPRYEALHFLETDEYRQRQTGETPERHRKRLKRTDAALAALLRDDAQCYAARIRPRAGASQELLDALEAKRPVPGQTPAGLEGSGEGSPGRSLAGLLPVGLREFCREEARFCERVRAVERARRTQAAQPLGRA